MKRFLIVTSILLVLILALSMVGCAGKTGASGATGPQGPEGPIGIQGAEGEQGATGPAGPAGVKGAKGDQGATGPAGAKGEQGIQGEQGIAGLPGATGAKGSTGSKGATGSQGIQGEQGIAGEQGVQGLTGADGEQGIQGIPGEAAVPFHGEGAFTITDGTYTTDMVNTENGIISASLVGVWDVEATATYGAFTATGTGSLYLVEEPTWGTTATVFINGIFSANGVSFLGMALRTAGDSITNDEVIITSGIFTISADGTLVAELAGITEIPVAGYAVSIDITGSILTSPGD